MPEGIEYDFRDIVVDFTRPVSRVKITALNTEEPVTLRAFNAQGQQIASDSQPEPGQGPETMEVHADGARGYIVKVVVDLTETTAPCCFGGPEYYDFLEFDLVGGDCSTRPDLVALDVAATCDSSSDGVLLTAKVRNQGDATVAAGLPVAFYRGNPASGGARLGVVPVEVPLPAGAETLVSLPLSPAPGGAAEVWAVADDNGTGVGREPESREDNNATSATVSLACSSCIDISLSDYNLFLLQDYNGGHDVEGKVAAGGNIALTDFSVGARVRDGDIANTLVAGGNLFLRRGGVHGHARYGGTYSADMSVVFPRGAPAAGTPIPFATRFAALRGLSAQLNALPANGTTTLEPWGGVMLSGTNPELNVFQVSSSAFTGAELLSISAPAGSLVVINITGGSATFTGFGHAFSGGIDQHGVLFNFVDATAITAHGYGFWGTVLAPFAHVNFSNGSFDGGIYAVSLTGNAEGHINPLRDRNICQ